MRWLLYPQHASPANQSGPARGGPMTTGDSALVVTGPPMTEADSPVGQSAPNRFWYSGARGANSAVSRCTTDDGTSARLSYTSSTRTTAVRPGGISGFGARSMSTIVRSARSSASTVETTSPSGPPASVSSRVSVAARGEKFSTSSSYTTWTLPSVPVTGIGSGVTPATTNGVRASTSVG